MNKVDELRHGLQNDSYRGPGLSRPVPTPITGATGRHDSDAWIPVRLQLFAKDGLGGAKTEKATPKKRKDARNKGQVMKSAEAVTAFILLAAFMSIKMLGGNIYQRISDFAGKSLTYYVSLNDEISMQVIYRLYFDAGIAFLLSAGPILAILYLTAFVSNVAQVGFHFTTEPLKFKPDKISPVRGFKRLFSAKKIFDLLKSLFKVLVVGYVAYSFFNEKLSDLMILMGADLRVIERKGFDLVFDLAFRICAVIFILAAVDYGWQWRQHEEDLKMSKQEVKEEFKQMEGDPKIKAKIKEKQRQISMRRMMSEVPKADVVITNPTHISVAVRYDLQIADAPVVLAKGQDYVALRIRKIAEENGIAIIENKSLARTLYDAVEVGGLIPAELYYAVAEILAYVYNMQNRKIV